MGTEPILPPRTARSLISVITFCLGLSLCFGARQCKFPASKSNVENNFAHIFCLRVTQLILVCMFSTTAFLIDVLLILKGSDELAGFL